MKRTLLFLILINLLSFSIYADSFCVSLYAGGEIITITSNAIVTLDNGTEVIIEAHDDDAVDIIVTIHWEELLDSFSMKVKTIVSGGDSYETEIIPALDPDMWEHCVRGKWL